MLDKDNNLTDPSVRGSWVQTERRAHEAWAELIRRRPRAASLLHLLVANMNARGALVASQTTLAELSGTSVSTVKRAVRDLVEENWIQTMRVGSERGGALAYVVNRRVAWADRRSNGRYALFDARVLVSERDNPDELQGPDLRQIPSLSPGDQQLPAGEGAEPPSQPHFNGHEPDLPAISDDDG